MSTVSSLNWHQAAVTVRGFLALCKPRVISLIVFTAVIGMFLAAPGMVPLDILLAGTVGIALVSGAAAAFNCLIEQKIDAVMARTRGRPLPMGRVTSSQTVFFATIVCAVGMWLLYAYVNPLTMWLTFATFVGYAVIYTVFLKPVTPMNIVIGGASGAMPPVLGWAAVTNTVSPEAWVLFLIIFAWTPPHFWSLALYRVKEYEKSGLPMLPVFYGPEFTRLHILLYTVVLIGVTMMPYGAGMNGIYYVIGALALDAVFLYYAVRLYVQYSDELAKKTFRYSIFYLSALFAVLLIDHYIYL